MSRFQKITKNSLNYVVTNNQPQHSLAQYLHAFVFSPALDTFGKAIKTEISSPGQASKKSNTKKIFKNTAAIAKGHLDQEHQGLQSTRDTDQDYFPQESEKNISYSINDPPTRPTINLEDYPTYTWFPP